MSNVETEGGSKIEGDVNVDEKFIGRNDHSYMRFSALFIILTAFALRLHALTRQDIWWDEARNIDVALRSFFAIPRAPELDIHPPFYFWLLHFWTWLNEVVIGEPPQIIAFISRYLSVAMGLLSVVLLYALVRLIVSRYNSYAPLCAMLIGAASPFWLAESQESRMYTLGFALLCGAAYFLLRFIRGTDSVPRNRVFQKNSVSQISIYVVLSTLALLTHYNVLFILVTWYLWWAVWALLRADRWRQLRIMFMAGVSTLVLLTPFMGIAWEQINGYANPNLTVPTLTDYLQQNWVAYLGGYAFDTTMLYNLGTYWLWLCLGLLIIGLSCTILSGPHHSILGQNKAKFTPLTFLMTWLIGGLLLYYIAILDRGAFNVRYSSFVTPALYGLLGIAVAGLASIWRPLTIIGVIAITVGFDPALYADIYDTQFDRSDVSSVVTWLNEVTDENDVIFVDQRYPFGFYYPGFINEAYNPYVAEGAKVNSIIDQVAPARYLFVDINTIDQVLTRWAGDARRVFWVQWFESDTDPRRSVSFLLDKAGKRAGERWFQGYSIDWWELAPPNQFELASTLQPFHYRFPPTVETVEVALPPTEFSAGDVIPVVIRWQRMVDSQIDRPLKARVALYNQTGERLAQNDKRLLNDRHLWPAEWQEGEQPLNVYKLETPIDLLPGDYEIRLLVYDAESLAPLGVIDRNGNHHGIEVFVFSLRYHEAD